MPYVPYTENKPVITDPGGTVIDTIRQNLEAIRDGTNIGAMKDWQMTVTNGTGAAATPQFITWSKGVLRIRSTVTWGTSGGPDGQPTVILYEFSGNSGSLYETLGTLTNSYDGDGNLTASTWS